MRKKLAAYLMIVIFVIPIFSIIISIHLPATTLNVGTQQENESLLVSYGSWTNATIISDNGSLWNNATSTYSAMAVDDLGGLHVVWYDYTVGVWGTDIEIFYANYSKVGGWSDPIAISGVGLSAWNNGGSMFPDIAVDHLGQVHVVWYDTTDGEWGIDNEIFYIKYTPGEGWSNTTAISGVGLSSWNTGVSSYPAVAVGANDSVHVVWSDNTPGEWGTDYEIFYINYTAANGWSNTTVLTGTGINSWNNDSSYRPDIAIDYLGQLHVVWYDYTDGEWGVDHEIFYMKFVPGIGWTNATAISGFSWNTGSSFNPKIAANGLDLHVVWYDNSDGAWGIDSEIMYMAYDPATGWSDALAISGVGENSWNDGTSAYPNLAVEENGRIHVTWTDYTSAEWGDDVEIMYMEYIPNIGWSNATVISDDASNWNNDTSRFSAIGVDALGGVHIFWDDFTDGWWGIDQDIMYSYLEPFGRGQWAWELEKVDYIDSLGWYTDIDIDTNNLPHIAYSDETGWGVKYAHFNGTGWEMEIVDTYLQTGDHCSIAVDNLDIPHICYYSLTRDELEYAKWNGTGWELTIVDSDGDVGQYTEIATDSSNYAHISYFDAINGNLKYARYNGTGWEVETVDSSLDSVGYFTDLALDDSDYPHIVYGDLTNTELEYTYWNGTDWTFQTIVSGVTSGYLCLDSNNRPHITYSEGTPVGKLLSWNGTDWITEAIISDTYECNGPKLFLDSSDNPHVIFTNSVIDGVFYTRKVNGVWLVEAINATAEDAYAQSIAVGSDGLPQVCYTHGVYRDLLYAKALYETNIEVTSPSGGILFTGKRYPITWMASNVSTVNIELYWNQWAMGYPLEYHSTIAAGVDANLGQYSWIIPANMNHSSFFKIKVVSINDTDHYDYSTRYFRISPQYGWFVEEIRHENNVYPYSSIDIDSFGNPHISYCQTATDTLKHYYWTGEWETEIIDSSAVDIGEYNSLIIDSLNNIHVSYYDGINNSLKYAYRNDSGWFISTVTSPGDAGRYCSIAVDSSNYPHISYYDFGNQTLNYAWYNGKQWYTELVDDTADVGMFSALTIDSLDYPHISYYDNTGFQLKYAYDSGGGWIRQVVDSSAMTGLYTSIAVDSFDQPYITYATTSNQLYLIYWNGTDWIRIFYGSMSHSSLEIDSLDRPALSAYYVGGGDLSYGVLNGTQWFGDKVDEWGDVGSYNSLALDQSDHPHFSYFRSYVPDQLKYAYQVAEKRVPFEPQNLNATLIDGNIRLTWEMPQTDGGEPITNYLIYRGTSPGTGIYLTNVTASTFSYWDLTTANNVTYYYTVTALSDMGESNASNEVNTMAYAIILLVDDDGGQSYETYFTQAMDANNTLYRIWDRTTFGSPSASILFDYKAVIWTTGAQSANTLTGTDQNNLIQFLDLSGRLYISSQDLLFDLGTSNNFVNNYLHVIGVTNDVSYPSVQGVASDPITDGFGTLSLNYPYTNDADEITIDGSATQIFTNPLSSNIIANKVDNGTFKLVFTAFAFEGIQNQDAGKGEDFLNRTLTWLIAPPNDLQAPTVNNPSNVNYAANSTNFFTNWILSDNVAGGYYSILRNESSYLDWTPWARWMNLTVPVDTNGGLGHWNYTIQYNDSLGNWGIPDMVIVTIFDNTSPTSNSPNNAGYQANSTGNTINWTLSDNAAAGYYRVLKNGIEHLPWSNWTIGSNLLVPVDTNCGLGLWNYIIQYNDSEGNFGAPDAVLINIFDGTIPISNFPPPASYSYGSTANIGWILTDNAGAGYYRVLLNESEHLPWQTWTDGANLMVPINTSRGLGDWNYTIQFNDSVGLWGSPNTVIITIVDDQAPTSNSPSPAQYGANSTGNTVDWVLIDNYASGYYRILVNDSEYLPWQTWVNGSNLQIPVDTNRGLGIWNYTIQYNDSVGLDGVPSTVFITIVDDIQPQSTHPPNANYVYGASANITWVLTDNLAPGYYRVLRGASEYQGWQQWENNTAINVSIDTTVLGIWSYIIQYNDSYGLAGVPDLVIITIYDDIDPTANTPPDASYQVHSINNYPNWILTDNVAGGSYQVLINDTPHTAWFPWTSGANLSIPVNTSAIGTWNYTIRYNDSGGRWGTPDMVLITIYDDVAPTSDSPSNASHLYSSTSQIQWTLTDNYAGGYYQVLLEGTPYGGLQAWSSGIPVNISVDTSSFGEYNYTIQFYDSVGLWGIPDTVFITIYETQAPIASQPDDAVYPVGTFGLTIDWILTDNVEGGFYRVFRNGLPYQSWQPWTNGSNLQVLVDTNEAGVWSYTVQFNDSYGLFGIPDTVGITIYDDQSPTINSPSNASYLLGSVGNTIDWIITDNSLGGNYRILRNTTEFKAWSPWENNSNLQVQIDTSSLGVWNYTIQFYDSGGLWGVPNTVLVTIYDNIPPTSSNPPDSTQGQNTSGGFISWVLYDTGGGGYYRVLINNTEYIPWTPWLHGIALIILVDSFRSIGTWNYTIQYNDSAGVWGTPNTVFVQISEAGAVQPPFEPSETDPLLIAAIIIAGVAIAAAIIIHGFLRRTPPPPPPTIPEPKPKSKPKSTTKSTPKITQLKQRLNELEKSFEEGKISQSAYESLKKDLVKRIEES